MDRFHMHIGAKATAAVAGEWFESEDPFTGKPWAEMPRGRAADADAAVKSAHEAFTRGPWAEMTASDRGLLLYRIADAIAANAEKLADLEVRDNGKLRAEMLAQMKYLPRWFQYFGGQADKIEGAVTPIDKPGMFHYVTYEPLGVVVAITPWNSPLLLTTWKLAPALAAGNTVVVKPSEFSSASMLALADIMKDAGLPPGVVNVVTGFGAEIGDALVNHPLVAKIAFTGGDAGGRAIYQAAAKSLKRVSLELGGKSAQVVFGDADLDAAVQGTIMGIFAATGQTCMAGSRLVVHRSVHDAMVAKLVELTKVARMGNPSSPDTQVGPVSTRGQLRKVLDYIDVAKGEGATCVLGGKRGDRPECGDGFFVEPTIFTGVTNQMRIAQEEVFGPVLSVIPFDTDEEAIAIANDTQFGLAAGVWTSSIERMLTVPKKLTAGTVWVNAYRVVSFLAPFGGFKSSGIGRENGSRAIYDYLEQKSVYLSSKHTPRNPFVLG
jgi:aldehyde dehydrogenase (NAD+)